MVHNSEIKSQIVRKWSSSSPELQQVQVLTYEWKRAPQTQDYMNEKNESAFSEEIEESIVIYSAQDKERHTRVCDKA